MKYVTKLKATQFKAFQDQLEEVADEEEDDAPVVYRKRKLLYIQRSLYYGIGRVEESKFARINTCCCYKHKLFVLLLGLTPHLATRKTD